MHKQIKVIIPSVPNFLRLDIGGQQGSLGIQKFTEADLKMIGEEWTKKLIDHARQSKANK